MAAKPADSLRKAREVLVSRRQQVVLGLPRLPDGELDRVVRYAEYLTTLQSAIDAMDRALKEEEEAERRAAERRAGDRRKASSADLIPPEGDRRSGDRRETERRQRAEKASR